MNKQVNDLKNPFIDKEFSMHPGPEKVEVEFSVIFSKFPSYERYLEILNDGATDFPWFHEHEFEGSKTVKQALRSRTLTAIRRILLAYMGGGTKVEIARRIPTSRSTVYKTILSEIYLTSDVRRWLVLGLLKLWDIPVVDIEKILSPELTLFPEEMPIVCLICHRVQSSIRVQPRQHDFSLVSDLDDYIWNLDPAHEAYLKGHLIKHFPLSQKQPEPNKSTYSEYWGHRSIIPDRKAAVPWFNMVGSSVLETALDDEHLFLPNVVGRVPTELEIQRFYQEVLEST